MTARDDMLETCLVLVVRDVDAAAGSASREVLLGEKRRGFGRGRVVAPGGKVDAGESPVDAAVRELREETGLLIDARTLRPRGVLDFFFPHDPSTRDMRAYVFLADDVDGSVTGDLRASDEIAARWVHVEAIPYDSMWPDARHWLPPALDGTLACATFVYGADGVTLERVDLDDAHI